MSASIQHEIMLLLRPGLRQTSRLSQSPVPRQYCKRRGSLLSLAQHSRQYATSNGSSKESAPTHRRVTVFNDTGRVNWGELSAREKIARSTQQSFNFAFVALGAVMVCGVVYFMWSDVFSPNSKTSNFNRAVTRIRASEACTDLLGPGKSIKATGESMWSSYARARQVGPTPMTSVTEDKRTGIRTIKMVFMVKGKLAEGWVTLHMEQKPDDLQFHYKLLALDVPGHNRVYLEGGGSGIKAQKGKLGNIFGVSFK